MQRNTGYFPTESLEPSGNRLFSRSALNEGYLFRGSLDLIPYNQTTVTETMVPSSHTRIKAFCRIIHNAGISVNIRTQFGSDINAACGQLAGAYRDDQKQGERTMSARDVKSFGEEVEASC